MRGQITFVAIRNIHAGEELTHDWAMTDNDDYSVECKCGAPNCRKILTRKDWQRPDLQARYAGYFSAYLADKIARRRLTHEILPYHVFRQRRAHPCPDAGRSKRRSSPSRARRMRSVFARRGR
ncbi:MAG: hypothetical protein DME69_11520 [Verrucomicrobia bacterium]|nr:MAG: hypothetical protein DME69_11520 [Verrucomicrobiota bacterium]